MNDRFERAHALLTSRLNSLDCLLTLIHLNIEQYMYDVQVIDIKRSANENDRNISNLRRQSADR